MVAVTSALAAVLLAAAAAVGAHAYTQTTFNVEQYRGHQVVSCALKTQKDLEAFVVLKEQFDLDVWTEHFGVGHKVDVRGSRSTLAPLKQSLACDVVVRDLAQQMYEENKARERHLLAKGKDAGFFDDYHTYEEIQQYYIDLSRNYPNLVTYIPSIGISNEGRDLFAIRIKSHANPPKTIYFEGLIHAREWISGATVAYTATKLVEGYGNDNDTTTILDRFEIVVVPITNPDGYAFSWTDDRLWRKNRRVNEGATCIGVDLNRNFDNHWGEGGSSAQPCAADFRGPSIASEPETVAVQNFALSLDNLAAGIDFHAYGQLILRSYGYTVDPSPNEALLKEVGDTMVEVIDEFSGKRYTSQRAAELYPTTGSADDWLTEGAGVWGWCIELPNLITFQLPPSEIIPTGEHIWVAFKYFAEQVWLNAPANKK